MIRPPRLSAGDSVLIVSPSRQIESHQLEDSIRVFKSWGLNLVIAKSALNKDGYFAGTDNERLADLQSAINDTSIKAIFCSRGGYGMTRILDSLDLNELRNNPKWIIGFSDITALHLLLSNCGIESIHGIMPVQFGYEGVDTSISSLHKLLFQDQFKLNWQSNHNNREGSTDGEIIGGNLSLLADSIGTKNEINTNGKILFLEEIDEYYYKIDRMLLQLKRAGKFNGIKGLIVGQFSDLKDTQIKFGKNLEEIILEKIKGMDIPISFDAPIGHEAPNLAIPIGRLVTLKVNEKEVILSD